MFQRVQNKSPISKEIVFISSADYRGIQGKLINLRVEGDLF